MAAILSTPVCGVAMRNDVEAAFDAPFFRNATVVGITPHEHNGKGIPIKAAFIEALNPLPDRCLEYTLCGTNE